MTSFLSEQSQTPRRRVLGLALLAIALQACALHEVTENPEPAVPIPEAFNGPESQDARPPRTDKWWRDFKDIRLDQLVLRALDDNKDIRIAWARLAQARALSDQADAGLYPELALNGNITRTRQENNGGGFGGFGGFGGGVGGGAQGGGVGGGFGGLNNFNFGAFQQRDVTYNTFLNGNLNLSYELDIWGRLMALRKAGALDLRASRAELSATAMMIAAQVAATYFEIIEQRALLDLLDSQLETNKTYLELASLRFNKAQFGAPDVLQQKQQVAATRTRIPQVRARLAVLEHLLATLLGQPPRVPVAGKQRLLPDLPPLPKTGVPAELLERRPDLRAARDRVEAADERIINAIAGRLPQLRVGASLGYQSIEPTDFFENLIGSIFASLTAPLFDGGRRAAEVDRTEAVLRERVETYAQTFLTALREVEDALVQERQQRAFLFELEANLEAARATLAATRRRYREGISDYLPVLTALQTTQNLEQTLISGRRQLLAFRIQLYRALGGAWTEELADPAESEDS